jgi:hypothetical protein
MTTWTASEMGKKGGASASPEKVKAARDNGRKGGRPILDSTISGAHRIIRQNAGRLTVGQLRELIKLCDKELATRDAPVYVFE